MVATILSLRWRTTLHSLRRDKWRILVVIAGAIWSISMVPSIFWAEYLLRLQLPDIRADAMTVIGAVIALGWVSVPLLVTGLDDTLDPTRFASVGMPARRLMPGLTVSAFLTVPAVFTLLAVALLATSWRGDAAAFAVALVGALLTVATMILSGRVAVAWAGRILTGRRSRIAAAAAALAGIALAIVIGRALLARGLESILEEDVPVLITALGTTPIAAGLAAPEFVRFDDWFSVGWRLAITAGWSVMLALAWRASVARSLVTPPTRTSGSARRDDRILFHAELADRVRSRLAAASVPLLGPVARGFARAMPSPEVRAVRSRALRYWASDPRYLAAGVGALVGPVLLFGILLPALGLPGWTAFLMPATVAMSLSWGRHNDVAYDSTALWVDVVSGRLGRRVMRGRLEALLLWATPVVVVSAVAAALVAERLDLALGLSLASLGVLGTTLGISAVLSVAMPYRAPQPGANPFGAEVGSVGAGLAAQVLSSLATAVTAPLVMLPFILAVVVHPAWSAVAAITGLALGVLGVVLGVRLSGDLYDKRSGRLLSAVV
ncbi:hypothetical protein [Demequina zhanjiangensis]|uniref:ABC-2 type transport system permease protein n=1 Tax=Demequina zhanjiangensis TaxID=3051659 RepID=A0ABT8G2K9_9MICO|nr:hypothetical protein [Demequina sp. SYSU T00b26]MDN4472924.1 hypothetical protein [Demequina sp. SYSU T00b26]